MKIALFVNSAKTFFWHRKSLADLLVSQGHKVYVICSVDGDVDRFKGEPYEAIFINMSRKGINPFQEISILINLLDIFFKIRPDICHNFTVKCVIYGSLTQRLAGVRRIINSITGLGIVFVRGGLLQSLVEILYRIVFWFSKSLVIFQNDDDRQLFIEKKIVDPLRVTLIHGSGVNTEIFRPQIKDSFVPKVVFASRLLRSKGVLDLLEASNDLIKIGIKHEVYIAGDYDPMSPDSLNEVDLLPYKSASHISFLGNVNAISSVLRNCHVACFPSYYREGVPKFLLEAASCGLAIITTDAPGCREVVDGNGCLVTPHSREELVGALGRLLVDPQLIETFGVRSRKLALEKFSEVKVLNEITALYF